jgi:hypothetical protein
MTLLVNLFAHWRECIPIKMPSTISVVLAHVVLVYVVLAHVLLENVVPKHGVRLKSSGADAS